MRTGATRGKPTARRFWFELVVPVLLVVTSASPVQARTQTTAPAEERSGGVVGRVVRTTDRLPVAKVLVTLKAIPPAIHEVTVRSAADGTFEFVDVPPGRYQVHAVRTGYVQDRRDAEEDSEAVSVGAGRTSNAIEIRLRPAGVISGRVYDEDGEPIEGVAAQAWRLRFSPGGRHSTTHVRSARTDDLGNYRLPNLAPGIYYVRLTSRENVTVGGPVTTFSYATTFYPGVTAEDSAARITVAPAAETRGIDVAVRAGATYRISGTVVDRTAAEERKQYTVGFIVNGAEIMQMVNADGSFTFSGVDPGEYVLVATSWGTGSPTRRGFLPVTLTDADVHVSVEIGRTAEVRGEVQTADGDELPTLVAMLRPERTGPVTPSAPVRNGKFSIRDVPDGTYDFELSGGGPQLYLKDVRCGSDEHSYGARRITVGQGLEACRLTVARDVGVVNGLVTSQGKPVPGAEVVLIPTDLGRRRIPRHTASTRSDGTGRFELVNVVPGEYFAFAVEPSDDAAHFEATFAERNQQTAVRITVGPASSQMIGLSLTVPER